MINTYKHGSVTWVDLESPTSDEVKRVSDEWKINGIVASELLLPTFKPKVDLYKDYIYLVMHFPTIKNLGNEPDREIDFVISEKFIITTRYDNIDPIHQFAKVFEVNSILERGDMGKHGGFVFYHMMKMIYDWLGNELDSIKNKLSMIETNTFSGNENKMVTEISKVARNIIDIKKALRPHREILGSLEIAGLKLFGQELDYELKNIKNNFLRLESDILAHSELLKELRDTNDSLLTTKQNETMKNLSVIAFIALPLGIFTALMQIDTLSRPIIGHRGDFWIILGIQIIIALALYSFSKAKKWL